VNNAHYWKGFVGKRYYKPKPCKIVYPQDTMDWIQLRTLENLIVMYIDREGNVKPNNSKERYKIYNRLVQDGICVRKNRTIRKKSTTHTVRILVLTELGRSIHDRLVTEGIIK